MSSNVRTRSQALKDLNHWRSYHSFSPIEAIVDDPSDASAPEACAIVERDEHVYQAEKLKDEEPTRKPLLERLRGLEDRAVYHFWILTLFFSLALELVNAVVWAYVLNYILPATAAWLGLFPWLGAIISALAFVVWSTLANYIWPDAFK